MILLSSTNIDIAQQYWLKIERYIITKAEDKGESMTGGRGIQSSEMRENGCPLNGFDQAFLKLDTWCKSTDGRWGNEAKKSQKERRGGALFE